jgi:hypothetical protein
MRRLFVFFVLAAAACGTKEPPRADAPVSPPAGSQTATSDDAARPLDQGECETLGRYIADTCENRGNAHSQQIDRWCTDITFKVNDGRFVNDECLPHIKHIDATCFRSSTSVRNLMDCESTVTRVPTPR